MQTPNKCSVYGYEWKLFFVLVSLPQSLLIIVVGFSFLDQQVLTDFVLVESTELVEVYVQCWSHNVWLADWSIWGHNQTLF